MDLDVHVFLYGSNMNCSVMGEAGLAPGTWEVARLPGFHVSIRPLANPIPHDGASVYGVLATATPGEIDRLYAHARGVLGGAYLPRPVLVERRDGASRPAPCYLAPRMDARPADPAPVERIVVPARALGFPDWNVARLEGFLG